MTEVMKEQVDIAAMARPYIEAFVTAGYDVVPMIESAFDLWREVTVHPGFLGWMEAAAQSDQIENGWAQFLLNGEVERWKLLLATHGSEDVTALATPFLMVLLAEDWGLRGIEKEYIDREPVQFYEIPDKLFAQWADVEDTPVGNYDDNESFKLQFQVMGRELSNNSSVSQFAYIAQHPSTEGVMEADWFTVVTIGADGKKMGMAVRLPLGPEKRRVFIESLVGKGRRIVTVGAEEGVEFLQLQVTEEDGLLELPEVVEKGALALGERINDPNVKQHFGKLEQYVVEPVMQSEWAHVDDQRLLRGEQGEDVEMGVPLPVLLAWLNGVALAEGGYASDAGNDEGSIGIGTENYSREGNIDVGRTSGEGGRRLVFWGVGWPDENGYGGFNGASPHPDINVQIETLVGRVVMGDSLRNGRANSGGSASGESGGAAMWQRLVKRTSSLIMGGDMLAGNGGDLPAQTVVVRTMKDILPSLEVRREGTEKGSEIWARDTSVQNVLVERQTAGMVAVRESAWWQPEVVMREGRDRVVAEVKLRLMEDTQIEGMVPEVEVRHWQQEGVFVEHHGLVREMSVPTLVREGMGVSLTFESRSTEFVANAMQGMAIGSEVGRRALSAPFKTSELAKQEQNEFDEPIVALESGIVVPRQVFLSRKLQNRVADWLVGRRRLLQALGTTKQKYVYSDLVCLMALNIFIDQLNEQINTCQESLENVKRSPKRKLIERITIDQWDQFLQARQFGEARGVTYGDFGRLKLGPRVMDGDRVMSETLMNFVGRRRFRQRFSFAQPLFLYL